MVCLAILLVLFVLASFAISLFAGIWFIIGNVWVFSKNSTVQYADSTLGTYCNQTLYMYAFWSIIATYILMVVSCCCSLCSSACTPLLACITGKKSSAETRAGLEEIPQNEIELETKRETAIDSGNDSD
jgi:hypothetical protein